MIIEKGIFASASSQINTKEAKKHQEIQDKVKMQHRSTEYC